MYLTTEVLKALKKANITSEHRKFIKNILKGNYTYRRVPKKFYDYNDNKHILTDPQLKLVSFIYAHAKNHVNNEDVKRIARRKITSDIPSDLKPEMCLQLSSTAMKGIYDEYNKIIDMTMDKGLPLSVRLKDKVFNDKDVSHKKTKLTYSNNSDNKFCRLIEVHPSIKLDELVLVKVAKTDKTKEIEVIKDNVEISDFNELQRSSFKYTSIKYSEAIEYLCNTFISANSIGLNKKSNYHKQIILQLTQIFIGEHYCVDASATDRIYHIMSNLKREFRQFLTINGNSTSTMDIRASQPSFLATLALNASQQGHPYIEADKYIRILETNRIYDYLANKYSSTKLTTDAMKKYKVSFLTMLFISTNKAKNMEIYKHFQNELPGLIKWIDYCKENKINLSHKLQNLEAEFIYESFRRIEVPAISIHDSLSVDKEDGVYVKEVMDELADEMGIPAVITIE